MNTFEKRFELLKREFSSQGELIHPSTLLQRAATKWPDRIALVCGAETMTYSSLLKKAYTFAQHLITKGAVPGDRILILYENSIEFFVAYHGAWLTGAIIAPLNSFLGEKELEHIVRDANPRLFVASPAFAEKVKNIPGIPPLVSIFPLQLPEIPLGQPPFNFPITHPPLHEPTVLLYTSGTTGLPKGVMLSGKAITTNCLQAIALFDISGTERIFAPLPLFHSYMQNTAVWGPLFVGAQTIIVPRITRKALIEGLAKKPTFILGIPHLYGIFCLMRNLSFPAAKMLVSGGDALHNATACAFKLLYGRRIANGYGLTEAAPLIAVQVDEAHAPASSVGKPLPGISISLRDENQNEVPQGSIGTIFVKGDNLMNGYYNAPDATKKILVDGWLNTGDLAYLDKQGALVICGREKDLIVNKGLKIYPQEIENVLAKHPSVMLAAVVGGQHANEEFPVAFVVPTGRTPNLEQQLKEHCRHSLAPYKVPRTIIIKEKLPLTSTGKIDKKVLKAEVHDEILKKDTV